jgi:hypothetical protein
VCEASSSASKACVVVERNFAALVVFADVWVVVALVRAAHECTGENDLRWVRVAEVVLVTAAAGTHACGVIGQQ